MNRRLSRRQIVSAFAVSVAVGIHTACGRDRDYGRERLRANASAYAYVRASDVDCAELTANTNTEYMDDIRHEIQWDSYFHVGPIIDSLILQIIDESLDRIQQDSRGYVYDLRDVAAQVEDDRAGLVGRIMAGSVCFRTVEPARFQVYLWLARHVENYHESFVRRQLNIADQIETDSKGFLAATRRRVVDKDPLGYSANPRMFAADLRTIADRIEANSEAYRDFLRSFGDRVSVDDPLGGSEYRRAVTELETPINVADVPLRAQRLSQQNIVTVLRNSADKITANPDLYRRAEDRWHLDLHVAAHRGVHASHAGTFRDWVVFVGFDGL